MEANFKLRMADGAMVQTIEELREHFDLATVMSNFENECLLKWLVNGNYVEEAKQITAIDTSASDLADQLCTILKVSSPKNTENTDHEDIQKNERLAQLKQYTEDEKILEAVDQVAFTQVELKQLLKTDARTMYLCGILFTVPEDGTGREYVGVNRPVVILKTDKQESIANAIVLPYGVDLEQTLEHYGLTSSLLEQLLATEQARPNVVLEDAIGEFYSSNKFDGKDNAKAVEWYRKAAEKKYPVAQKNLAYCYHHGIGVHVYYAEAARWYRKAADAGNREAMFGLGQCYRSGQGVEQDIGEAIRLYREAAEAGIVDAMYELGDCCYKGEGMQMDKAEAVRWFRKVADAGNIDAMFRLAECYEAGDGVAEDTQEAVRWIREAAEAGSHWAMYNLGRRYKVGDGVEQDMGEAFRWYREAAEAGRDDAMYELGRCYEVGDGVEENVEEALRWYHKAANGGDCRAMVELGVRYNNGNGVEANRSLSVKWYRKVVSTLKWIHSQGISSFAKVCAENGHPDWAEWIADMESADCTERMGPLGNVILDSGSQRS